MVVINWSPLTAHFIPESTNPIPETTTPPADKMKAWNIDIKGLINKSYMARISNQIYLSLATFTMLFSSQPTAKQRPDLKNIRRHEVPLASDNRTVVQSLVVVLVLPAVHGSLSISALYGTALHCNLCECCTKLPSMHLQNR